MLDIIGKTRAYHTFTGSETIQVTMTDGERASTVPVCEADAHRFLGALRVCMKPWVFASWRRLTQFAMHSYARFAWILPLILR